MLAFSSSFAASYAVSVRRASVLPAASSGFHLAMDTLAVRLTIPPAGFVEDFHLRVSAPCRAHKQKGDGCPSPFCDLIRNADSLSLPAATTTLILVVNFLLVEDVTAGSANRRPNRGALSAADQRASQRADASPSRRAPDRFAGRVLAVIIATEAIISIIVVVVPG